MSDLVKIDAPALLMRELRKTLKPCPFCGSPGTMMDCILYETVDEILEKKKVVGLGYECHCENPDCIIGPKASTRIYSDYPNLAAEAWNNRTGGTEK